MAGSLAALQHLFLSAQWWSNLCSRSEQQCSDKNVRAGNLHFDFAVKGDFMKGTNGI